MEINFLTVSHSLGAIAYLILSIYIATRHLRRATDRTLFVASLSSAIWLALLALQGFEVNIPFYIRYTFELIRNTAWFGVLYALLGIQFIPGKLIGKHRLYSTAGILILLAFMLTVTIYQGITNHQILSGYTTLILQVSISVIGLLLLEQVWQNSSILSRSGIKYLTIAMASLFFYDFFMYSDALLFQKMSTPLWESRGAINTLAAPLIAMTMFNSRKQPIGMHVSRQMIFHSTTLIIAGIYLLIISAGGYYISIFGGSWGEALRVLFIFLGILILVILVSSPIVRAKIMVFISKNFFDYKYDYRDEWIKSTDALTNTHSQKNAKEQNELPTKIIKILGDLVGSRSGAIWGKDEDDHFVLRGKLALKDQKFHTIESNSDLSAYFKNNEWVINLDEYMLDPTKYDLIEIPDDILTQEQPWLLIPLGMSNNIVGIVLLCEPIASLDLNWENYDLIKIVSQQACSYLEQSDSQERLGAARQFEAVNQTSAFLVHDIKTIIAQLSLLVKNAERHKTNPEFIEDMIRTTSHTVEKMEHLLNQIHNPTQDDTTEIVELGPILLEVYESHKNSKPIPSLEYPEKVIRINANKEQLKSVIVHIVQNALDATPKDGEISITSKLAPGYIFIFIQDNGYGMNDDFINNLLFKPFKSTKGLTGMGIGVYQSREYLRRIGGSISVTSQLEIGTCFTLKIPVLGK
ncbi:MAG: putative PEP-CTERM system histidine kinase [Oleiphilaceae bacterium]|jgi:putative PEP-CTERM system histidine kinase